MNESKLKKRTLRPSHTIFPGQVSAVTRLSNSEDDVMSITLPHILRLDLDNGSTEPYEVTCINSSNFVLGTKYFNFLRTEIPDDNWILGIGYRDDKGGDAQQGLTGTCKERESFDNCAIRETYEEARIVPTKFLKVCRDKHKNSTVIHHFTSALDCSVPDEPLTFSCSDNADNKKQKISNTIFGTREQMVTLLTNIAQASSGINADGVSYIIATPVSIARTLVHNGINETKKGNLFNPRIYDVAQLD